MSLIQQALEKSEKIAREAELEKAVREAQALKTESKPAPKFSFNLKAITIPNFKTSRILTSAVLIAAFTLAFFLVERFQINLNTLASSFEKAKPKTETQVAAVSEETAKIIPKKIEPAPKPKPEPKASFVPLQFPSLKPQFKLSGITISGGQTLALVNNQVVAEGDRLKENAIVKKIADGTVTLEYNGKEFDLTL